MAHRPQPHSIAVAALMLGALLLASCGGSQGGTSRNGSGNPAPAIGSFAPISVQVDGPGFTLELLGTGFISSSTVNWNGSPRTTTFVSSTELRASIPGQDRSTVGSASITVVNPPPGGGTSPSVRISIINPLPSGIGVLQMISVAGDGTPGDGDSFTTPAISADGRYVALQSTSTNLIPGSASGFADIYLRDTCIGAASGCTPSTTRISVNDSGELPNGNSRSPAISADARYVLFDSSASNLVSGDTNGQSDVFMRSTCIGAPDGCVPHTFRVSLTNGGSEGNDDSRVGTVSADGRYVAFHSVATNLVSGDTNGYLDVFVRDTCLGVAAGCTPSTIRVSVATDGTQGDNHSFNAMISENGRYVAFKTGAKNLVPNSPTGIPDMLVRDTCRGAASACSPSTMNVNIAYDGGQPDGQLDIAPSIDTTGRHVAFTSFSNNLVTNDTNGLADVFVRDTCAGASGCTQRTGRISVAFDGSQSNQGSADPSISADGRYVAFDSLATNLIPGGTLAPKDVFVRDTCFGAASCSPTTILVSRSLSGSDGNGESLNPALSSNGQYVVFMSSATSLIDSGSNGNYQVWIAKVY
jgi:Tol biopolymer transport system component